MYTIALGVCPNPYTLLTPEDMNNISPFWGHFPIHIPYSLHGSLIIPMWGMSQSIHPTHYIGQKYYRSHVVLSKSSCFISYCL